MKLKNVAAFLIATVIVAVSAAGCQNGNRNDNNGNDNMTDANEADNGQQNANGDGNQQSQGKGRFLESEIVLPEEMNRLLTSKKLADGTIEVAGMNTEMGQFYLARSKDQGSNWETVKVDEMNHLDIRDVAIAPDGTVAFCGSFEDYAGTGEMNIKLANVDGIVTSVNLIMPELPEKDRKNQILQAAYDNEGNLLILDFTDKIYRVDTQSGSCTALCDTGSVRMDYFAIAGDTLMAVISGSEIQLFSTVDGSAKDSDAVLDELAAKNATGLAAIGYYPMVFTAGHEEGSCVYANHDGVFYHGAGGSVSEQLINGELTSLGDSSTVLAAVMQLDEVTYILQIADSLGNTKLLKYTYDENASAVPEKMLKVYALEDSVVLQQAIAYYQKSYPDVFVKKEIGLSGADGISVEDALLSLSTAILAGEGPDVLILDGAPVDSYIEKGILADISSVINEIDSTDGIFSNIKNIYQQEGKIYYFPTRFFFSVIAGDQNAVAAGSSIEALTAYAKEKKQQDPGKGILPATGAKGMLQELMDVESANWMKADGGLDQAKLEKFLSCAKEMFELDSYSEEQSYAGNYEDRDNLKGFKLGTMNISSAFRQMFGHEISFGTMGRIEDYSQLLAVERQMQGTVDLFDRGNSKTIIPYLMVGVAENSNDKEGAMNFIRTMLGKECESVAGNGFPINRAAFEFQQENQSEYSIGGSTQDGDVYTLDIKKPTEEEYNKLIQMIESLEVPVITDRIVRDLVMLEGIKYLNNEQSSADTVTAIMQKVNLYLSE